MALKGNVDCQILPNFTIVNSTMANCAQVSQQVFVALHTFLLNQSASLGIQRIAYHTGSNPTLSGFTYTAGGMNHYDLPNPAGVNSWATFKFTSASLPFYLHIQWAGGSYTGLPSFGAPPGFPASVAATAYQGVGIQFAVRSDGGNAWGGTTFNNGQDVKSNPIWVSGSSALAVFPRTNSIGGNYFSTMAFFAMFHDYRNGAADYGGGAYGSRLHMMADTDNFYLINEMGSAGNPTSNNNNLCLLCFSRYTPAQDMQPLIPYVMMLEYNNTAFVSSVSYGDAAGAFPNHRDGGIAHVTASLGVKPVQYDFPTTMVNTYQQLASAPYAHDEFPLYLFSSESPASYGFMGYLENVRLTYAMKHNTTLNNRTRVAFGYPDMSYKITFPWGGNVAPGNYTSREGIAF